MELLLLIKIGFLPITFWDLLDVLIVGYLFYILYSLSRGTLALNIVIGLIALVVLFWIVQNSGMSLLGSILGGLAEYGFVFVIVMFQPEIRRFLILFGRNFLKGRSNLLKQIFGDSLSRSGELSEKMINKIVSVTEKLSSTKTGALIIFTQNPTLQGFDNSGVQLDARISTRLIESIFQKGSPLHDGAMIIADGKIYSVGSILPVSNSHNLPKNAGLRHRAGVGISETTDAFAIIVSEETGKISTAKEGKLVRIKNKNELYEQLKSEIGTTEPSSVE